MGRSFFSDKVGEVVKIFNDFYNDHKDACDEHIRQVKAEGLYNNLETRLAWDFARATSYSKWMPKDEKGFVAGDTAKQTTLFKQALRKSKISY